MSVFLPEAPSMCRTAAPGSGRRQEYLPQLQALKPGTTGSVHWVEGSFRTQKWDYANPRPVQARHPPNHVRTYQWTKKRDDVATNYQEALRYHGTTGDSLNIDSLLIDRPEAVNSAVEFDLASPLQIASMRGHSDLAQLLIHRGADMNRTNHAGQTSLHTACESNRALVVMDLLAAGADADLRDSTGQTPLHRAAFTGSDDCIIALLDYGANTKLRDQGGLLAVHKAASMGRSQAIALLLERAPTSVNAEAASGWTPLHFAAHGGHPGACEMLVVHNADVHAADQERSQPLHRAATFGSEMACQVLLQSGADPSAMDISRNTPLHAACEEGCVLAAQVLLEGGAPVRATNGRRWTPLHVSAEAGRLEMCELLLQYEADPAGQDISKGVPSPLAIARRQRHVDLVALLEAAVLQAQTVSTTGS